MRMPVTHACEDTRLASRSWLSPALLPTVNRLLRFLAVLFNHPQCAEVCGGVSPLQRSEQAVYAVHRNLRFAERVRRRILGVALKPPCALFRFDKPPRCSKGL